MSMHPVDGMAAVIRRLPADTDLDTLAAALTPYVAPDAVGSIGCEDPATVAAIIRHIDPDRKMGSGSLAMAIWNDLNA